MYIIMMGEYYLKISIERERKSEGRQYEENRKF